MIQTFSNLTCTDFEKNGSGVSMTTLSLLSLLSRISFLLLFLSLLARISLAVLLRAHLLGSLERGLCSRGQSAFPHVIEENEEIHGGRF